MFAQVTAKKVWDPFYWTQCSCKNNQSLFKLQ